MANIHSQVPYVTYLCCLLLRACAFFFFNDTATTEIYTLSLHDALPISTCPSRTPSSSCTDCSASLAGRDRKSTRLNSSHDQISYAVFCLKKKNNHILHLQQRQNPLRCKAMTVSLLKKSN